MRRETHAEDRIVAHRGAAGEDARHLRERRSPSRGERQRPQVLLRVRRHDPESHEIPVPRGNVIEARPDDSVDVGHCPHDPREIRQILRGDGTDASAGRIASVAVEIEKRRSRPKKRFARGGHLPSPSPPVRQGESPGRETQELIDDPGWKSHHCRRCSRTATCFQEPADDLLVLHLYARVLKESTGRTIDQQEILAQKKHARPISRRRYAGRCTEPSRGLARRRDFRGSP